MHNLEAMAAFYQEVFGLVPFNRHQDEMLGRKIDEITCPGGSALTFITYLDSTGPIVGESVQGFNTNDIEALVARVLPVPVCSAKACRKSCDAGIPKSPSR